MKKQLLLAIALLASACNNVTPAGGPPTMVLPNPSMVEASVATGTELAFSSSRNLKLDAYQAEYQDPSGKPIPALAGPRVAVQIEVVAGSSVRMPINVVTPAVLDHGRTQAAMINCRLTFYGTDANGNAIELVTNVPIRFQVGGG